MKKLFIIALAGVSLSMFSCKSGDAKEEKTDEQKCEQKAAPAEEPAAPAEEPAAPAEEPAAPADEPAATDMPKTAGMPETQEMPADGMEMEENF